MKELEKNMVTTVLLGLVVIIVIIVIIVVVLIVVKIVTLEFLDHCPQFEVAPNNGFHLF